jgi:hypothetical protein
MIDRESASRSVRLVIESGQRTKRTQRDLGAGVATPGLPAAKLNAMPRDDWRARRGRYPIAAAAGPTQSTMPIAPVIARATRPPATHGGTTISGSGSATMAAIRMPVGGSATLRLIPTMTTTITGRAPPRPIPVA